MNLFMFMFVGHFFKVKKKKETDDKEENVPRNKRINCGLRMRMEGQLGVEVVHWLSIAPSTVGKAPGAGTGRSRQGCFPHSSCLGWTARESTLDLQTGFCGIWFSLLSLSWVPLPAHPHPGAVPALLRCCVIGGEAVCFPVARAGPRCHSFPGCFSVVFFSQAAGGL